MNTGFNNSCCQLFTRYKRTDLKWYKKFWNIITGHKDRNWKWVPVGKLGGDTRVEDSKRG